MLFLSACSTTLQVYSSPEHETRRLAQQNLREGGLACTRSRSFGGGLSPISDADAIRQKILCLRDLNAALALVIIRPMADNAATGACPVAPILRQTVYTRTLHRACELLGGVLELALHLRVAITQLQRWMDGVEVPPQSVFLAAVDVVSRQKPG